MARFRRAGRKTFLKTATGAHVYIPTISSTHYREYRVIGIRARTLKDIQLALDGRLRLELWDKDKGQIVEKRRLNHDNGEWEKID